MLPGDEIFFSSARFLRFLQRNWPFPVSPAVHCPDFAMPQSQPSFFLLPMQDKMKGEFSCSACGHHLHGLTHLFLDCPETEPLRSVIFGTTIFDL